MSQPTVSLEKKKIAIEAQKEVHILGECYKIRFAKYEDDAYLKDNDLCGYCDLVERVIVIAYSNTVPGREDSPLTVHILSERKTIRHEIVHAFLMESGLDSDSISLNSSWARNEEMVDWFAIQGPKIMKAWQEADAL